MSTGLTLTYMTTKVPNFAHGSVVTIGAYVAFTIATFLKSSPYYAVPMSVILGGAVAVGMYKGVLHPLARRGSSIVALMIATLAVDIMFVGIFGIYSDYLTGTFQIPNTKFFLMRNLDFSFLGLSGLFFVAPACLAGITFLLHLLLNRTKFGVAMRASIENPHLAQVLGINIDRVFTVSWFLAGALAGLAGTFLVIWLPGRPSVGSDFIVAMFAASILGGLTSIYGSILGGIVVGAGEVLVTVYASRLLGSWVIQYQLGIPLIMLAITLLIFPRGLSSLGWGRIRSKGKVR